VGLKTGSYYIRSKPSTSSESFTLDYEDNDDDDNDKYVSDAFTPNEI
jgi:hypothetical protein